MITKVTRVTVIRHDGSAASVSIATNNGNLHGPFFLMKVKLRSLIRNNSQVLSDPALDSELIAQTADYKSQLPSASEKEATALKRKIAQNDFLYSNLFGREAPVID